MRTMSAAVFSSLLLWLCEGNYKSSLNSLKKWILVDLKTISLHIISVFDRKVFAGDMNVKKKFHKSVESLLIYCLFSLVINVSAPQSEATFPFCKDAYKSHCMWFPPTWHTEWCHANSSGGVSFTSVSSYNSAEGTRLISQVTTCWCVLCSEGVARHFFSPQLISAPAKKGGCDGPIGSEGLTARQEGVREKEREKEPEHQRFLQLTLFLWPANHSKQTKEHINCSWTTLKNPRSSSAARNKLSLAWQTHNVCF